MSQYRLQITVNYNSGKWLILPHPHRDDPRGRRDTHDKASEMLALPTVESVQVHRTQRTAASGKGRPR